MPRSITNYQIKLLAAIFMVIDHVGAVFFPNLEVLRFVGRFSFPLFAWLLVQGETHTRNFWRYLVRLLLLGVVSQPIFWLTFNPNHSLNILFTLAIGLVCLRAARLLPALQVLIWSGGAVLAHFVQVDYGAYGIGLIALVSLYQPTSLWWLGWLLLHFVTVMRMPDLGLAQAPVLCAPIFFELANHRQGKRAGWFYLFYPAHLLVLWLIERLSVQGIS